MADSYISSNIQNGKTFEAILEKILAYNPGVLGFVELDCNEISTKFSVPTNSLYYLPCGNYRAENLPNSPIASEFVNILVFDANETKYILAILGHKRFSVELSSEESPVIWTDVSAGPVQNPTFLYIGNTAPTDGSLIWVDTSTLISGDYIYVKYFDGTSWKNYVSDDLMDINIYDQLRIGIDPFQYILDRLSTLLDKYAEFIRHKNNEFTLQHLTDEERDFYDNELLTLAEIIELFKSNGEVYHLMLQYIAQKTLDISGYTENNQKFLDSLDEFGEHSFILLETTIGTNSRLWFDIVYGKERFVAIAFHSNVCACSRTGITWTEYNISDTIRNWTSICYGNDKFVIIAKNSNIAAYSSDGITWTEVEIGSVDRDWNSICYGNNKYVAIASGNTFAYSSDGITWTEVQISTEDFWYSICYGDKFVAVSDTSNKIAYSNDGVTWSIGTISSSEDRLWKSICYGNNKYIAVSYDSNIFAYSSDGIQWQEGNIGNKNRKWNTVCYGKDRFIAFSYESKCFTYILSNDIWTSVSTLPYQFYNGAALVYNNEIHLLGGNNSTAYTSHYKYNGTSWTSVSTLPYDFHFGSAVIYDNEIHIMGGGSSNKHYKYDGTSWTNVSTLPYRFYYGSAVVYNNEIHILGSGGNSSYSTNHYKYDGTSWTSVSTLPYQFYNGSAVVYNNEIHILGSNNSSYFTSHYKYDGTSWTNVSTLPRNFYYGSAVVYDNEIHIIGGGNGSHQTSHYKYDGSSWTSVSTLPYQFFYGSALVYNNEIHILGSNISNTSHYKYSTFTCIQGTMTSDAKSWYSACYGINRFVIVAQNTNMLANLNGEISDHVTSEKVDLWDSKSDSNHTHNLDGNVTIDSTNISTSLYDSQVSNANEKIVKITSLDILGEDISEEDLKTKYKNGNTLYTQDSNNNTMWWKILDNSKFGKPTRYLEGVRYLSSVINIPSFNMILNKPTTVDGYGITDADVRKVHIDACMTNLTRKITPAAYDKNNLLKETGEYYPLYLGIQTSKLIMGGGTPLYPMSTVNSDLDIIIVCDKSENLSTPIDRFTCDRGTHTYLNRNSDFIHSLIQPGISKHSSIIPASKYFTTLYNEDSENPKWNTHGLGRMLKVDTSQNNVIMDEAYTINNRKYHVQASWNNKKGIVFSIQLGESMACYKEVRDTLVENTDEVSAKVNQMLEILANI